MNGQTDDDEQEGRKTGGKGEQEGAGAAGISKATVSPAFLECMARFGVPMEKIAEIFRNWTHLKGAELTRRLIDLARGKARASAHLLVQFDVKGGFALVTNFLSALSGRASATPKSSPDKNQPRPR